MRRFDVRAGLESIDDIGAPVTSVRASHDGNCLLAGCMDGGVRLLDKAGGDLLATYRGANDRARFRNAAKSKAPWTGAVRLLDKAGGDLLATHRGGLLLHARQARRTSLIRRAHPAFMV